MKAIHQNGVIRSNDFGTEYFTPQTVDTTNPLLLAQFFTHEMCQAWDARGVHNNDVLEAGDFTALASTDQGCGTYINQMRALDVPCVDETGSDLDRPDDAWVSSTMRATPDGFLKSLNVKLRLTLPSNIPVAHPDFNDIAAISDRTGPPVYNDTDYENFWRGSLADEKKAKAIQAALDIFGRSHPMHTPHYEFRLIMFRNRLPTYRATAGSNNLDAIRNGVSLLNPAYDLFMGQTGRPRGFVGYRTSPKLDKDMDPTGSPAPYYSGKIWQSGAWTNGSIPKSAGDAGHGNTTGAELFPAGENVFTHRDLMTMPLNKNDYVVMRDVRFFLGQAQGKSHFEDVFDFDFNDPINTADTDLCSSDTLADKNYRWHCIIIGTSNGKDPVHLNYEIRGTTCCQSG